MILFQNVSSHGECPDGLVARQDRHVGGGRHHGNRGRRHFGSHVRTIELICYFTDSVILSNNHNNQVIA